MRTRAFDGIAVQYVGEVAALADAQRGREPAQALLAKGSNTGAQTNAPPN
jgi:hypothetical protein